MQYATYCPEDDKLRLYTGRVSQELYKKLRAEGWTSTPKQTCDFVAKWTPERHKTALEYSDIIEDEDQDPASRAADRTERFANYRDKREFEALEKADQYEGQPLAHGFQDANRAERAARRHDRIGTKATDLWAKAEYWQQRTAGVISNALYRSLPSVRMGRIKEIETEINRAEKEHKQSLAIWNTWLSAKDCKDPAKKTKLVNLLVDNCNVRAKYRHPRNGKTGSLYSLAQDPQDPITTDEILDLYFQYNREPTLENDEWYRHQKLRLNYEHQMLEDQGSRCGFLEMEIGGFVNGLQIRKINRSAATKRIVSVQVHGTKRGYTPESDYKEWGNIETLYNLNVERLDVSSYKAPTPEDIQKLEKTLAAEKSGKPEKERCPLVNPTDDEAFKLQGLWNQQILDRYARIKEKNPKAYTPEYQPSEVVRLTQAQYTKNSTGSYARYEASELCVGGLERPQAYSHNEKSIALQKAAGPVICKVRKYRGHHEQAACVVIITDKPQKPLPTALWTQNSHTPNSNPRPHHANQQSPEVQTEPTTQTKSEHPFQTIPEPQAKLEQQAFAL
jgi:hypothetical protein